MADAAHGPALLLKKLGGLLLIILGRLATALGSGRGSPSLVIMGIVALAIGVILLVLKIKRRNAG